MMRVLLELNVSWIICNYSARETQCWIGMASCISISARRNIELSSSSIYIWNRAKLKHEAVWLAVALSWFDVSVHTADSSGFSLAHIGNWQLFTIVGLMHWRHIKRKCRKSFSFFTSQWFATPSFSPRTYATGHCFKWIVFHSPGVPNLIGL